jgi:carboxyl-terminal processing protease
LLASAIEVSDLYISEGRIVSTEGRNVPKTVWDAHKAGTYGELPMVVLANRYSASASEIVSACLQDHDRAIVVGERTWGKGSVQNIISLEQGRSALKLTTAKYMRPSGKNIHRDKNAKPEDEWGVKPNHGYEVKYSNQELRNLETQRRSRLIVHNGQPIEKTEEPENAFIDRQLVKAIDYLLIKTDQKPVTEEKEPKAEEKEEKADPEADTAAETEGTSSTRPSRGRRGRRRP